MSQPNRKIATLLYHDVVEDSADEASGFPGAVADRYKLTPARFDKHLSAIAELRHVRTGRVPTLEPPLLPDFDESPHHCLFSFDDGGVSALTRIAPALEAHGWRGLFFITTDYIGQPGFLSPEQIRELAQRGHLVGSHSCSHPRNIAQLDDAALLREWTQSRERLSEILGAEVRSGSVPGGFFSPRVADAAGEAGLTLLFNSEPVTSWSRHGDLQVAGRLQIVGKTSARAAAHMARSGRRQLTFQKSQWKAKKIAKRTLGASYRTISERFFSRTRPAVS